MSKIFDQTNVPVKHMLQLFGDVCTKLWCHLQLITVMLMVGHNQPVETAQCDYTSFPG